MGPAIFICLVRNEHKTDNYSVKFSNERPVWTHRVPPGVAPLETDLSSAEVSSRARGLSWGKGDIGLALGFGSGSTIVRPRALKRTEVPFQTKVKKTETT